MPSIDCGAAKLHYEITGNAEGRWLMLSNSLGTDLTMWDHQVDAFGKYFHVIRYDMRGHGGSSVPVGPYTIPMLGGDVLQLLDLLDASRAHFCGLSIGGVIGQWLGVNAPERLGKLVLCNTAGKIGTPDIWNSRIERVRSHGMAAIADGVLTRWFSPPFVDTYPSAFAAMRHVLIEVSPEGYIASCEAIRDMDQREIVKQISIPTLIVAGEFDSVTTVNDGAALCASIQGSRMVTVPAAHISNVEAPSSFNSTVLAFLQEAGSE